MKNKTLKVVAMSMALMLVIPMNAFATPINLSDSAENIVTDELDKNNGTDHFTDETTNNWQDGSITEEARVNVQKASTFGITIPKEIVLDGSTGTADYKVKVKGDIAGDQKIIVTPDTSFILSEAGGKADVTATVTQPDTEYVYTDLQGEGTEYDGNIAATLSAGNWSGSFYFNIDFKASAGPVLPAKAAFNDMSWADIATVSEAGKAPEYFNIGDEKELTIGEYSYYDSYISTTMTHPETTYHVQILGFNHDDKSDGTGKAGITVCLKEVMTTKYAMNSSKGNIGGWEQSEMRTYLQNDVYNALPSDLQSVIKTVNKKSDIGNKDTTTLKTTEDKLFLFSFEEVGFTSVDDSYFVSGQGTKYEYFTDNTSRIKYKNDNSNYWWLRSASTFKSNYFYVVNNDGNDNSFAIAYDNYGVVFGFSI